MMNTWKTVSEELDVLSLFYLNSSLNSTRTTATTKTQQKCGLFALFEGKTWDTCSKLHLDFTAQN